MSKYTMELRRVIDFTSRATVESYFTDYELTDYLTQDEIDIINSRGTWTKEKLARDIVDHYFMREIGLETIGLFKHQAMVKMREIMQEKLPLIYSASIEYDPLVNVDYTETFTRTIGNTSSSTDTSTSNASGLTVNSDTPQGQISKETILAGSYASNTSAGDSTSSTNGSSSGTANTNEDYSKQTKGNSGVSATAQAMIKQYRQNIIAINKDIIEELSDLFFGLY